MSLELKYFVLKPKSKHYGDLHAAASRTAMRAYARMVRRDDPDLAHALMEWANSEQEADYALQDQARARIFPPLEDHQRGDGETGGEQQV